MTSHWLFPGFSSLVSFFMRRRSVWLSVLLLEVRWPFFFGGGVGCGGRARRSGSDDNAMQKFPNFSFVFYGSFVVTPCTVLPLEADEG